MAGHRGLTFFALSQSSKDLGPDPGRGHGWYPAEERELEAMCVEGEQEELAAEQDLGAQPHARLASKSKRRGLEGVRPFARNLLSQF